MNGIGDDLNSIAKLGKCILKLTSYRNNNKLKKLLKIRNY